MYTTVNNHAATVNTLFIPILLRGRDFNLRPNLGFPNDTAAIFIEYQEYKKWKGCGDHGNTMAATVWLFHIKQVPQWDREFKMKWLNYAIYHNLRDTRDQAYNDLVPAE